MSVAFPSRIEVVWEYGWVFEGRRRSVSDVWHAGVNWWSFLLQVSQNCPDACMLSVIGRRVVVP